MRIELTWSEVAIRLALTVAAGTVIGINRGEHGRAVGLCTTILVCVAASVSMIQANLLLATHGKAPDSFIVLDLMRLPLGILSGMGFIGAGAILRRGEMVRGITTAATLWFVTVMGLCFGGGQLGLGLAMLGIGVFVLWVLKWLEGFMQQERQGRLMLSSTAKGPSDTEIREHLAAAGMRILSWGMMVSHDAEPTRTIRCELRWNSHPADTHPPAVVAHLARHEGVRRLRWKA